MSYIANVRIVKLENMIPTEKPCVLFAVSGTQTFYETQKLDYNEKLIEFDEGFQLPISDLENQGIIFQIASFENEEYKHISGAFKMPFNAIPKDSQNAYHLQYDMTNTDNKVVCKFYAEISIWTVGPKIPVTVKLVKYECTGQLNFQLRIYEDTKNSCILSEPGETHCFESLDQRNLIEIRVIDKITKNIICKNIKVKVSSINPQRKGILDTDIKNDDLHFGKLLMEFSISEDNSSSQKDEKSDQECTKSEKYDELPPHILQLLMNPMLNPMINMVPPNAREQFLRYSWSQLSKEGKTNLLLMIKQKLDQSQQNQMPQSQPNPMPQSQPNSMPQFQQNPWIQFQQFQQLQQNPWIQFQQFQQDQQLQQNPWIQFQQFQQFQQDQSPQFEPNPWVQFQFPQGSYIYGDFNDDDDDDDYYDDEDDDCEEEEEEGEDGGSRPSSQQRKKKEKATSSDQQLHQRKLKELKRRRRLQKQRREQRKLQQNEYREQMQQQRRRGEYIEQMQQQQRGEYIEQMQQQRQRELREQRQQQEMQNRCSVPGCTKSKEYKSNYCSKHTCPKCRNLNQSKFKLCDSCRCSFENCKEPKQSSKNFCSKHSCRYSNIFCKNPVTSYLRMGTREATSPYCVTHKCRIEGCKEKIMQSNCIYCSRHNCHKAGCKNPSIKNKQYCAQHC